MDGRADDGAGVLPGATAGAGSPGWAVTGTADTRGNLVNSIHLEPDVLEAARSRSRGQVPRGGAIRDPVGRLWRGRRMPTSSWWATASSRGCCAPGAEAARRRGLRVGLLRPITLFPFPSAAIRALAGPARDVRSGRDEQRASSSRTSGWRWRAGGPVEFYSRVGGNIPTVEEVLQFGRRTLAGARGTRGGGRRWPLILRRWRSSTDARRPSMRPSIARTTTSRQTHYVPGAGMGS